MNEYKAEVGEFFYCFAERVKSSLKQTGMPHVYAEFNGYKFTIHFDSNVSDIATIYELIKENDRLKTKEAVS